MILSASNKELLQALPAGKKHAAGLLPLLALALLGSRTEAQTAPALGELFAGDSGAKLVQPAGSGMSVVAGSELSAGSAAARLRLYRGGQIRICPRSSLSVNTGASGLMLAMGSGMIEVDYTLAQRGSDFLLTPDFSVQLTGPGQYHFALGVNKSGDTCVKTLAGNNSSVVISELLSAAVYKTKLEEAAWFNGGKLNSGSPLTQPCGCPPPSPVVQAAAPVEPPPAEVPKPGPHPAVASHTNDNIAPVPAEHPGQVHVQVDTPFVFSAKDRAGVEPYAVAKLNFSDLPNVYFVQEKVDPVVLEERATPVTAEPAPPPSAAKKPKKGFLGHLKGFFGGIFRH